MLILLRYFSREVLASTGAVTLVLLLVLLSNRFAKYLDRAAAGDLDTATIFMLIFYRIPDFLQLILPLGLFIALLLVYGRMYLDNEMRVLFAAGLSRSQLLLLTYMPVVIVAFGVGVISLWISPAALKKVDALLEAQGNRSELDAIKQGRFQAFKSHQGVIYAETITEPSIQDATGISSLDMQNVYVFQQQLVEVDGKQAVNEVVMVAKSGHDKLTEDGHYLLLQEGYRIRDLGADQTLERTDFGVYGQRIGTRDKIESRNIKIDAMSSAELSQSGRNVHQAAWQWRLSLPALVLTVSLVAIALGRADPRQGRYLKLFPAILIYLLYLVLLNVARDKIGSGDWSADLAMWVIHAFFLFVGLLIFNWERIRYGARGAET